MSEASGRGPGRPRGSAGTELLDLARDEFLTKGYAGTTMDGVARRARISKHSLYGEFASKQNLFAAVVSDWVDRGADAMRPHMDALLRSPDTTAALHVLARTIQAAVLSSSVRQMRTLVAAEATRFPDVAADYVTRSWERNTNSLAEAFAALDAQGAIRTDTPVLAAEQFTWLVVAAPLNRMTLDAGARPYPQRDLDVIADEAVATFLARYGTPRENHLA